MTDTPVTDHAVLRYLERVQGFDIEAVRQHIWRTCRGAVLIGATCVRAEGVKFEFKGGRVVTVAPDQQGPSRERREAAQRKVRAT